jgi:hypothetical protein
MDTMFAPIVRPEPDSGSALIARYQKCVYRILDLFGTRDPLPPNDPAHFLVERLESILDRGLLAPKSKN